jgi:hypothetical protein
MIGSVRIGFLGASLAIITMSLACDLDGGHSPVARASATPDTIDEHDGYQTLVTLDAAASADPIDDPEGQRPLRYQWRILGDEYRFETGDEHDMAPVVSFRGDLPATVELTVTDEDGDSHTVDFEMRLTVR